MSECGSTRTCSSTEGEDSVNSNEVVIVEGFGKFRDGKRWKQRYCVLSKLSPAADCLQLQIYRDEKERARNGHTKASLSLQHFLAMESGFTLDKESYTLAIICQDLSVVLAFDNRERLIQWSVRISNNLGEGHQFLVQLASAPPKSKLNPGPVKLHVTDKKFCLTGGLPPKLLGFWEVTHLRRYGLVDGRLIFEGGSRCGKGEGIHVLVPDPPQTNLIIDTLDMSSKGQLIRMPSRRFGNATDSPRKSVMNRFWEARTMSPPTTDTYSSMSIHMNTNASCSSRSPTPRESRSADELCAPMDGPTSISSHSFWMNSDSSSRSDLDHCDSLSIVTGGHGHQCPTSPSRAPMSSVVPKPLPSAMERCLSCMSKLGQGAPLSGPDVLRPSWTMDLTHQEPQGNADRVSLSSHGSSGGGIGEYYYDTPRTVISAEMRRTASSGQRPHTPPHGYPGHGHCSPHARPGCESPQRQGGCTGVTCSGSGPVPGAPIYYNIPESAAPPQRVTASGGRGPINPHPCPGPYENYDFPRVVPPVSINPGALPGTAENGTHGGCCAGSCNGSAATNSGNEWNKNQPKDRTSIASSVQTCSDHLSGSDWYDSPRRSNDPCPSHFNGFPKSMSGAYSCHSGPSHSHYQPVCPHARDPLENYDFPQPSQNQGAVAVRPTVGLVNGEGKMPLVAGSSQIKLPPAQNPAAIYAIVDKSKKTPRQLPPNCDTHYPPQPVYINTAPSGQAAPKPPPKQTAAGNQSGYNPNNYVNLEFADSLPLYENSRDSVVAGRQTVEVEVKVVKIPQASLAAEECSKNEVTYANEIIPEKVGESQPVVAASEAAVVSIPSKREVEHNTQAEGLPLRRSSSVPCKGGHANRGSASSSDSGVSGDGGLYFEDSSPLNELGSLCLHESLPRKGQRSSPTSSSIKIPSDASTPKEASSESPVDTKLAEEQPILTIPASITPTAQSVSPVDENLANRHYETIDEAENSKIPLPQNKALNLRNPRSVVHDATSTSSGASDMSDYIETLSTSSSRGSRDHGHFPVAHGCHSPAGMGTSSSLMSASSISASPKKAPTMKPRSGKEYFKIDRTMFSRND